MNINPDKLIYPLGIVLLVGLAFSTADPLSSLCNVYIMFTLGLMPMVFMMLVFSNTEFSKFSNKTILINGAIITSGLLLLSGQKIINDSYFFNLSSQSIQEAFWGLVIASPLGAFTGFFANVFNLFQKKG